MSDYTSRENTETFNGTKLDINARSIDNTNLLLSTGFRFVMQRTPYLTYFCQTANLPEVALQEMIQPTPFVQVKHPGNTFTFGDLNINFLVDEDMEKRRQIYNWMASLKGVEDFTEFETNIDDHFCDATLMILNSSMRPNIEIRFKRVFPKSLGGIDFTSDTSDSAGIAVNASFGYTSYEVIKL